MNFTVTCVGATTVPIPPPSAATLLALLRAAPDWETMTIAPPEAEYPRALATFHADAGFVIQCYENPLSCSDFLVNQLTFSTPRIQVALGGQALELWPPELFVSEDLAVEALDHFLSTGRQTPTLGWIRIDRFPRASLAPSGS